MAYVEYTIASYLDCKKEYADKIVLIKTLIEAMYVSMAESIGGPNSNINEYNLDDGQVKVKTVYRSIKEVQEGIFALEQLKAMYENKLYGRVTVLRNSKNMRR